MYVAADPSSCVEILDEDDDVIEVCGEPLTEWRDDGEYYALGDFTADVGTRFGYIIGNAWWYEDFASLDLSEMGAGFDLE